LVGLPSLAHLLWPTSAVAEAMARQDGKAGKTNQTNHRPQRETAAFSLVLGGKLI
jgi:hypothetical protein